MHAVSSELIGVKIYYSIMVREKLKYASVYILNYSLMTHLLNFLVIEISLAVLVPHHGVD